MATDAVLNAAPRTRHGKGEARRLRAAGRIPAVVYGKGEAAQLISVDARETMNLFSRIPVESTIISLKVEGGGTIPVLVREVQFHPHRPEYLHVDFYEVQAGEEVTVEVPVRLVGTPEGVRVGGGVLDQVLYALEVRCDPNRIPEAIEVDVSALEIGGVVYVSDLPLPAGVTTSVEGDRTVCSVAAPTVAAVEPGAEGEDGVGGSVQHDLVREPGEETAS